MPKTNFSKVEKALEEGLIQKLSGDLLHLLESPEKIPKITIEQQKAFLSHLDLELLFMKKHFEDAYMQLEIKRRTLKTLIASNNLLTALEWEKIRNVKKKIDQFRLELKGNLPQNSDEDIVNAERKKHINKRFNVKDKWLPLT